MNGTGMLWIFRRPKVKFATNLRAAISHYTNKYGKIPNLCMVNPTTLCENYSTKNPQEFETQVKITINQGGKTEKILVSVKIRQDESIPQYCFFVGSD